MRNMLSDFKIPSPEKSFSKNERSINANSDEDISTVFRDLHVSAFSKAASISPVVTQVTLGAQSEKNELKNTSEDATEQEQECLPAAVVNSSTPEKKKLSNLSYKNEFEKMKQKVENLSPIGVEKEIDVINTFSYQKLLCEFDVQRRLTVDKVMRERIQNMYENGKLIRDSLEHLKQTREEEAIARRLLSERKILDDIHEQEILNRPKREAQWAKDNLKEAQRIQERNQRVREAEEEAKKKLDSTLAERKMIDKIFVYLQKEYQQEYKNILGCMKSCKSKSALTGFTLVQSKALKECTSTSERILKKCKQGGVSQEDEEDARKLVETIKSIHESFAKEVSRINELVDSKKEEAQKKVEEEQKKIEEEQKKIEEEQKKIEEEQKETEKNSQNSTAAAVSNADLSDCFDAKSLENYLNLKSFLESVEKSIEPLLSDDSMKKFRFNCQKAVNIPVNAISPVSGSHLCDKYQKLYNLLSGKPVEVGDTKVTASQHPFGILYCKYLLAKKFVRQGDLTVSSKPDAAFSIAAVLASLWVDFPDFGQLVLAHFQSVCPYLAPVFMPQVEKQSDEEYHKSLGYHYSQNGEVEKQDSFLKRMSGIMRLYSALLISRVRQPGKMNPLGLSEGWRWISALLNLDPRPDICATLLYDFLEVAGNEMFRAYGAQFKKILAYICQEYFPKLEKVTPSGAGGPMVRLEGFLQKILKEESIPPPQGVLPHNFW